MKIIAKNGCDFRPKDGDYSHTTLVEMMPEASLGKVPANVILLIDACTLVSILARVFTGRLPGLWETSDGLLSAGQCLQMPRLPQIRR